MTVDPDEFEKLYRKVAGIVNKTRQIYFIQLWDYDDWHQEGRLILYRLLTEVSRIEQSETCFYRYFKTKFINHVKDILRHQESQKRKFNKMPYLDIQEMGDKIRDISLSLDELVTLEESLNQFESRLSPQKKKLYRQFIRGERFKGKKEMQKALREHLKDFND